MAQALVNRREIEMEQLEVDRIQTINLEVLNDRIVETDEILSELHSRNLVGKTRCLQQIAKNRFRWSLNDRSEAQQILQELNDFPLVVNCDRVKAHYASKMRTFILYDTPFELSKEDLKMIFSEFGKVQEVRRTTFKNWPQIHDGRIILTYQEQTMTVPECIKLGKLGKSGRITIREPGERIRKRRCHKCHDEDHEAKDCPGETICFQCGEQGHRKKLCPNRVGEEAREDNSRPRDQSSYQRRNEVIIASQNQDLRPEFMRHDDKPSQNDSDIIESQGAGGAREATEHHDKNMVNTSLVGQESIDFEDSKVEEKSLDPESVIDSQYSKLRDGAGEPKATSTPTQANKDTPRKKTWADRTKSDDSEQNSPISKIGKVDNGEKNSVNDTAQVNNFPSRLGIMSALFGSRNIPKFDTMTKLTAEQIKPMMELTKPMTGQTKHTTGQTKHTTEGQRDRSGSRSRKKSKK